MGQMADRTALASPHRHRCMHRSARLSGRTGQAVIEYTMLLVMLATIAIGVMVLAGDQLGVAFNDVSYDVSHVSDPAPVTVAPHPCPDGTVAVLRHTKWRCKNE
jgi:Flp pilus assembly pilin Flp